MSQFEKIDSSKISVVVQGPIKDKPQFQSVIDSIRTYFPHAEMIISTWPLEELNRFEAQEIILNVDPGGFNDINGFSRNLNRQIVSTISGLRASSRDYVLKTRTDIIFESDRIAYLEKSEHESLLENKITTTNIFVRKAEKIPFLFHPSDVVMFGKKVDLLDFWEVPLEKINNISILRGVNLFYRFSASSYRLHPEQYLCTTWLSKHGIEVNLKYPSQLSFRNLAIWISVLLKNFSIINYENSGIIFPKHFFNSRSSLESIYDESDIHSLKTKNISLYFIKVWFNRNFTSWFCPKFVLLNLINLISLISPFLHAKLFKLIRLIRKK